MFAQVELFPEQASTNAAPVDNLFFFILIVTTTAALAVAVLLIYFAVHYRARGQQTPRIHGSLKLEAWWTVLPFLLFIVMFVWGAHVFFRQTQPPADALEVYVVGKQWMWKLQHVTGQREINELHVPVNTAVKLTLTSEDVIHDFFVPAFRMKMDAVPGRYTHTWFKATKPGRYHIFCAQYCGTDHAGMVGTVVVMDRDDYTEWLGQTAEGSLALKGRKLFLKLQCVSCHSADSSARAPNLEDLYDRTVYLRGGGKVTANADYIKESILRPAAKVVDGYDPIMPTFEGQVNDDEMIQLIEFIKHLRPGQTPKRTEEAEPPALRP